MGDSFYKKQLNILKSLSPDILDQITRGIEKENIRSDDSGNPTITAHPKQLGAALTHPSITTDFSENLLEVITPAISGPSDREQLFQRLN